jgi:MoxR-like ATPase
MATDMLTDTQREALKQALDQVNTLVLGKPQEVRLAFVALLSDGHLLIEDLPGLGKTTLAHALAATLGLGFQRVQFTSDLLPSDIVGVSVFDAQARRFEFHPGPVFAHVLLPMKSTARHRARRARCSKRWPNTRSPSTAARMHCPIHSS